MQYQQIEITIGKDGIITERIINGDGETCINLTAGLEKSLGNIESQELLPDSVRVVAIYLKAQIHVEPVDILWLNEENRN